MDVKPDDKIIIKAPEIKAYKQIWPDKEVGYCRERMRNTKLVKWAKANIELCNKIRGRYFRKKKRREEIEYIEQIQKIKN